MKYFYIKFSIGFVPTKMYKKDWLKRYMETDPQREHGDVVTEDQVQCFYEDVMKFLMVSKCIDVIIKILILNYLHCLMFMKERTLYGTIVFMQKYHDCVNASQAREYKG